ncbi:hypothetical protein CCR94_16480 [Rhodoblastus sphagnicola]|uniref:Uncharacterized protein n=1 Tax=Rhodoblastus sphagnicola TaxID=333368 RepID=A0A2S6N314_9HYPH|nr:hypothetical protein [Rhodoblastus sphagnicola]MBB4199094.1 hypothetical protein [Rhodoblastus sphagnicola]PPQ28986.1 hypothetical protein CCR94_16480 [Rhodoblastus sphagnicola]
MSRAEGLRAWRDYLAANPWGVELKGPGLELLKLTLEVAVAEIEALEQPERLKRLAAKAARDLAVARKAEAVVAAARSGKLSVLAAYRMSRRRKASSNAGGVA